MGQAHVRCVRDRLGTAELFDHWLAQERAALAEERAADEARRAEADRVAPAGWWIFPLFALSITVWAMAIWMIITE